MKITNKSLNIRIIVFKNINYGSQEWVNFANKSKLNEVMRTFDFLHLNLRFCTQQES